jgi:hypothetical protein
MSRITRDVLWRVSIDWGVTVVFGRSGSGPTREGEP